MFKSGFVSVVGSPNAGKSTMINTIIGKKVSIVSEKAQTTRDLIKGVYTSEQMQIVFLDTPGFHKSYNKLNVYMNHQIDESLYEVDLILYIVDAEYGLGKKERENIKRLREIKKIDIIAIVNKLDLVSQPKVTRIVKELNEEGIFRDIIATSFKEEFNVDGVLQLIKPHLSETVKFYEDDQFYDYSDEFFISEIIREKVFKYTNDEIPHSVGVKVNDISTKEGILQIEADIYVERNSQKGIVVGRAGTMIKKIGQEARVELKREFKTPIYLDLQVKVLSKWGQKQEFLEMIGYEIN